MRIKTGSTHKSPFLFDFNLTHTCRHLQRRKEAPEEICTNHSRGWREQRKEAGGDVTGGNKGNVKINREMEAYRERKPPKHMTGADESCGAMGRKRKRMVEEILIMFVV